MSRPALKEIRLGIDFNLPGVSQWDFLNGKLVMGSKYIVRTNYELHFLATIALYNLGLDPEIWIDDRVIPWVLRINDRDLVNFLLKNGKIIRPLQINQSKPLKPFDPSNFIKVDFSEDALPLKFDD